MSNHQAPSNNGASTDDARAPDTPIEVIVDLLQAALRSKQPETHVQHALDIAQGLDRYMEAYSSKPPPVLNELLDVALHGTDWRALHTSGATLHPQKPQCCAGHLEGRFLKMLVALTGAKHVLEVGMFMGTTTLAMAEAVPDDGCVVALELDPFLVEQVLPYFARAGLSHRIQVRTGPALESMRALRAAGRSFDLAFVDADKPSYPAYYEALMDGLLAPGGLLVLDNTLMKGRVYTDGHEDALAAAMQAVNAQVVNDPRVEVVCLPFRDGVSLVRRRLSCCCAGNLCETCVYCCPRLCTRFCTQPLTGPPFRATTWSQALTTTPSCSGSS